jgi:hypothetical protein
MIYSNPILLSNPIFFFALFMAMKAQAKKTLFPPASWEIGNKC